jgi:alpha,alpha-trehalase
VWSRARTFSNAAARPTPDASRNRRLSHDEVTPTAPRRFLIDVEETMRIILEQEDTDMK